jgi:signal transduction histidine kinase
VSDTAETSREASPAGPLTDPLLVQAPIGVALYDAEGRVAMGNAAYERHFGIRVSDVPADYSLFTDPQLEASGLLPLIRRAYAGEAVLLPPVKYDAARATDGPGRTVWTQGHCFPVRDAAGVVTHMAIVHVDVTSWATAESALAERNAQLEHQQVELEHANRLLQEQTIDLEMQSVELHAATDQLAERTEAAEALNEELRASNAALAASETRYRALFESVEAGFCIIEVLFDAGGGAVDYRFLETNPAFVAQTGLVDAVGRSVRELVPNLESHWFEIYGRVASTGEPTRFENGSDAMGRWFDVFAFRVGDPEDRQVALLFTDISAVRAAQRERERLVAALEIERSRLSFVFQKAPAFLAVLRGPQYLFELANEAYYQLVGHRELIGKPVWEALPEVRGQGFEELLDGVIATGEPFIGREVPITVARTPDARPEQRFVDLTYMPLVEADGQRAGIIAHGTDVTAQVLARHDIERLLEESEQARADAVTARREAEAAQQAAEAANRAKAEFLATMSHELRTPLNAIAGYTELLELGIRGPVTDAQRTDLSRIQQSQRHLLGLVNEVLDLAKVDAGALRVERAPVRVGDTVDAALALVRPQAAAKALSLSETCGGSADRPYLGDEARVRQVLVNLLANAVKFTDSGGRIAVECALTDVPAWDSELTSGAPYAAIRVHDTGRGIPASQLGRIFEPFTQAEGTSPYTRSNSGTGLGLAISRRLARLMGGDLTVETREGEGSVFTLWLPTVERRTKPRISDAIRAPDERARGEPDAPELMTADETVERAAAAASEHGAALARLGMALTAETGPVVSGWVARMLADPEIPKALPSNGRGFTEAELEDHAATFVSDVGLAMRTLSEAGADAAALMRDGTAIRTLISERHGAQRARLGWTKGAVAREFALLTEELGAALRRLAGPSGAEVAARAEAMMMQLLAQSLRVSLGAFRLVVGSR